MTMDSQEAERLRALVACAVLDTPAEREYDDLVRLASLLCECPIALVSLVDQKRQWFKARVGLDMPETPRTVAFCAHTIRRNEPMIVADALRDPRFKENPLVLGAPHLRFYAGVPLHDPEHHNLGSLCVLDHTPRRLTPAQVNGLEALARQVVVLLQSRRREHELERARAQARYENDRFMAFINNGPAIAFMKDEAGRYVFVNEPLVRRFGLPAEGWIGHTDEDIFPAEAAVIRQQDGAVLDGGTVVTLEEAVNGPDGERTHWKTHKFPVVDAEGHRFLAGISVDVTLGARMGLALAQSEAKFRNVVDRLAEGIMLSDGKRYVDANDTFLDLLGYTREEFLALGALDVLVGGDDRLDDLARIREQMNAHGRCDIGRREFRTKRGEALPVELRSTRVSSGPDGILDATIVRDVRAEVKHEAEMLAKHAELEALNTKLKLLSETDGLTGVSNRSTFERTLAREIDRAQRYGHPLALLMLDIDHFKAFNDAFGHPAGDEVIRRVAQRMRENVRTTDDVARYGGEEFAIILPETDVRGARDMAERLCADVAAAPWPRRAITISIGVAIREEGSTDPLALVDAADAALYRSKREGRNRVSVAEAAPPASVRVSSRPPRAG